MPFKGNVFQGQVSNPGVGSGINAITTTNYALAGMINNEANNRNRLINSALGVGGKVFTDTLNNRAQDRRQEDQQTADVDLLKMKIPFENANKQASLLNAAQSAEDNGDPGTAQQLRALASRFGGGVADMFQTPGINGEVESQSFSQPSGSQTSTNFKPILDAGTDLGIPQGQEFALPKPEPFSGFSGTYSGQENQADVAKKTADAQSAKINFSNVQGLQQAQNLPDGVGIRDASNTKLIGFQSNPYVKDLFATGADLIANDPKKANDQKSAIKDSISVMENSLDAIQKIENSKLLDNEGFFAAAGRGIGSTAIPMFGQAVREAELATMGLSPVELKKAREAFNGNDYLRSNLPQFAKNKGQTGALSDTDIALAEGGALSLNVASKEQFLDAKEQFVNGTIPRLIEKAVSLGQVQDANRLQKIYKKATGDFYSGPESIQGGDTNEINVVPQRNNAPITENNIVDDSKFEIGGAGSIPFSEMTLRELTEIDESTLTPEDQKLFFLRLKQIKNGR
jgi:hypothetical protein